MVHRDLNSRRFELRQQLGEGGMGVVYEAYDHETDAVVALKTLRHFDADTLLRFKNEFRALADLQHPNLVRFGELCCERGQWYFTMELVRGVDFQQYTRLAGCDDARSDDLTRTQPLSLVDSLASLPQPASLPRRPRATKRGYDEARLRNGLRQLALALDALHRARRVHRDVKPSNVLVREDGHLLLLDFGLIEEVRRPRFAGGAAQSSSGTTSSRSVTGTPAFCAPEQIADERVGPAADWYAFGTMLFLALTGQVPFGGPPDQMIAAKQSCEPPDPCELCSDVPEELNALCRALLRRDPDARPGLREILRVVGESGATPAVTPESPRWSSDSARVFIGRRTELEALVDALATCRAGHSVSVVVEGEPGVGKSALVRQFLEQHVALDPNAVILAGRCYEQEAVPFKAFDTVIDSLTRYLAELDDAEVAPLLQAGTRYLASVFPVLRRVPSVAGQGVEREVDNPMALRAQAFQELKRLLFAMAERVRLVIFVDDLQWADKDSLALLEHLIDPPEAPRCLLLVTRRRSSDADSTAARTGAAELSRRFRRVELAGLSRSEAKALWTRLSGSAGAGSIAERQLDTLLAEAAGHPLFLAELVRYTQTQAEDVPVHASLQDVLWERVRRLDDSARRFMECVALAGAPTRFQVVAKAAGIDVGESLPLMNALRIAQMIRVSRRGEARLVEPYHDRVREALLDHLERDATEKERAREVHLRIGQLLLESTSEAELPTEVFAIVHHLNLAAALLVDAEARHRAAELNLLAARQARMATAYDAAVDYLARGIALLDGDGDPWRESYALCSALHVERMEAEYLAGRREQAVAHFEDLLPRLGSETEIAELFVSKIGLDTGHGLFAEAIATGRRALPRFGVRVPDKVTMPSVLREYAATRLTQGRRRIAELGDLPELADVTKQCGMKILIALAPPAFFADTPLVSLVLMRIARMSMKHGLTDVSSYGFAGYGLVLSGAFLKHEEAHEFGELALRLNQRFRNQRLVSKLHCLTGTFLTPWVRPFADGQEQLRLSNAAGLKYGDTAYEAYSAATLTAITFCEARDLGALQECAERCRVTTTRRRDDDMNGIVIVLGRWAEVLRGRAAQPHDLSTPESSDADLLRTLSEERTPTAMLYYYFCNGFLAYWFDERDRAARLIDEAVRRLERIFSIPSTVEVVLMEVLIAADRYARASWPHQLRLDWTMRRRLAKLRRWARACPQNFEAQYLIARAQRAHVRGAADAGAQFEVAIAQARRHGAALREAMALELYARRLRERGRQAEADTRVHEAAEAYLRCGAHAKVEQLRSAVAPATSAA